MDRFVFHAAAALFMSTLDVFAHVAPQTDLFSLSLPLKLLIALGLTYLFIKNLVLAMPLHLTNMVRDVGSLEVY